MKSNIYLILGIVVILAGGGWYFSARQNSKPETNSPGIFVQPTVVETESRYKPYSQSAFESTQGMKRVLFFHAPWCPTCRPADASFRNNPGAIPNDVALFKVDYDSSAALKKQYSVTYQHTYVLVDDAGKEVKKWNGGGIEALVTNTK